MKFYKKYISIVIVFFAFASCRKFVEVNPPTTSLVSSTVYTTDASATSAVLGIYSGMMTNQFSFTSTGTTLYAALSADEFTNYSSNPTQGEFYKNSLSTTNTTVLAIWSNAYNFIYDANAVLNGLENSASLSPQTKKQLEGEALFIRSFCYFYLVNFFGDVPLILSTDYKTNNTSVRNSTGAVFEQVTNDLIKAQTLLSADFSFSNGERVRPTSAAASALLARVYLYRSDWTNSKAAADLVINNPAFQLLPNLNDVFLMNNMESIFQLYPVRPGVNTFEGNSFILQAAPASSGAGVALSNNLLNAFDSGDNRKKSWIDSITTNGKTYYYSYKYKVESSSVLTEYYTVLRLAEQYLIRAEAKARLNDLTGAAADLNVIRNRAGLASIIATNQQVLMDAIIHERQTELFSEWGNRWFDLKRTNRADSILSIVKQGWKPSAALFPIPDNQIKNAPGTTQNPGY
jgi:hypothetical protein